MESGDKGLEKGAIGFLDGVAIGLDPTAPGYSLAAVIGSIVVRVGVKPSSRRSRASGERTQ